MSALRWSRHVYPAAERSELIIESASRPQYVLNSERCSASRTVEDIEAIAFVMGVSRAQETGTPRRFVRLLIKACRMCLRPVSRRRCCRTVSLALSSRVVGVLSGSVHV